MSKGLRRLKPTIDGNPNQETNIIIVARTEVIGRIEDDIETITAMASTGKGRGHVREIETGGISDETMSVRDHGHERNGGDRVESEDEMMITLTDGGHTTIDRTAETEIAGRGAAVDLVRHILGGGVAVIDDRLYSGNEMRQR